MTPPHTYLWFPLEDNHAATLVTCGQQFPSVVELDSGDDVSLREQHRKHFQTTALSQSGVRSGLCSADPTTLGAHGAGGSPGEQSMLRFPTLLQDCVTLPYTLSLTQRQAGFLLCSAGP